MMATDKEAEWRAYEEQLKAIASIKVLAWEVQIYARC